MGRKASQQQRPATVTKTVAEVAAVIDTVTNVKQSVDIVQTLVHGSISSLLFLRKLLPASCFVEQSYAAIKNHGTYEQYASGLGVRDNLEPEKYPGWSFKSLRRGKSTRADRLLDWLERGVFDALQQGFLRSLQLSITENADQVSNVLELYTYTFRYKNATIGGGAHAYSDVEMTGPSGEKITIKKARTAMIDMVRSLVSLCGTMPRLPESRFVRLHLFYNENVPKLYEPEGFAASTDHSIYFPQRPCQKVTAHCGEANAGFHTVYLKVSHLRADDAVDVDYENEPEDGPPKIPIRLVYKYRVSRLEDIQPTPKPSNVRRHGFRLQYQPNNSGAMIGIEAPNEFNTSIAQQVQSAPRGPHNGPEAHISTPSNVNFTDMDLDIPILLGAQYPRPVPITTPYTTCERVEVAATPDTSPTVVHFRASSINTTPSAVLEELVITKGALQKMLQPSAPEHDMQETQRRAESMKAFVKPHALQLSQTTVQQLEIRRSILSPPMKLASAKDGETAGNVSTPEKVECECGWDGEEADMIHCDYCDTWQHLHCYGYRGTADSRIPDIHACYQCLLQGREEAVLRQLRGLALLRRGIHTLETKGFASIVHFKAALDCPLQTATKLIQHFRSQNLVSLGMRIDFIKSEENISRMMADYFDPSFKIAHHFELPPSPVGSLQPALMETQHAHGNGRGKSLNMTCQRRPSSLQVCNRILSQPNAEEASAVTTPRASRLSSKRSRDSDDTDASALKRLKSSATGPLAFGDSPTPSPGP